MPDIILWKDVKPSPDAPINRGGRPALGTQSPKALLRADMIATSKLNREMRGLIETLVGQVKIAIADQGMPLATKLEIISTMTGSLQNAGKSMESIVKLLLQADATDDDGGREPSSEDILKTLRGR